MLDDADTYLDDADVEPPATPPRRSAPATPHSSPRRGAAAVATFTVRKLHPWRGIYERVLSFDINNGVSTWDPDNAVETNRWPWEDVNDVVLDDADEGRVAIYHRSGLFGLFVGQTLFTSDEAEAVCVAYRAIVPITGSRRPSPMPPPTPSRVALEAELSALRRRLADTEQLAKTAAERAALEAYDSFGLERVQSEEALAAADAALDATEVAQAEIQEEAAALSERCAKAELDVATAQAEAAHLRESLAAKEQELTDERAAREAAVARVMELSREGAHLTLRAEARLHHAAAIFSDRVVHNAAHSLKRRCFEALRRHTRETGILRRISSVSSGATPAGRGSPGRRGSPPAAYAALHAAASQPAAVAQLAQGIQTQAASLAEIHSQLLQLNLQGGRGALRLGRLGEADAMASPTPPRLEHYTKSGIAVGAYSGLAGSAPPGTPAVDGGGATPARGRARRASGEDIKEGGPGAAGLDDARGQLARTLLLLEELNEHMRREATAALEGPWGEDDAEDDGEEESSEEEVTEEVMTDEEDGLGTVDPQCYEPLHEQQQHANGHADGDGRESALTLDQQLA